MRSFSKNISYGVLASWLNRALAIGLNLLLIPILFHHMGKEELGLWFLLGQSSAFLALMDFGLAPTVTRRIAFCIARRRNQDKQLHNIAENEMPERLEDLIAVSISIYRYLSVFVFLLSLVSGILFLYQLDLSESLFNKVFWAWTIMSLGFALNIWSGFWSCLIQGCGYVSAMLYIGIVINVVTLSSQITLVLLGGGLVELAVISVIGALLTRIISAVFIYYKEGEICRSQGLWDHKIFHSLMRPAYRAWLTVLGGFLILKTDQYFIASFKGVSYIPAYHAAYQLASNIYMLAVSLAGSASVFVSYLWSEQRITELKSLVIKVMQSGLSIMVCGVACLLLAGDLVTDLWLGEGNFIGFPILITFCVALVLQAQHEMFMTLGRATEDEAYSQISLIAGVLNLALTFVLIQQLGLWGVALGTLIAQLLTNNWYGVYRALWRLNISFYDYLKLVVGPILAVFLMAVLAGMMTMEMVGFWGLAWVSLLAAMAGTGLILLGAQAVFLLPGHVVGLKLRLFGVKGIS